MATFLSRLVLVLALVLFGGHQADAHRAVSDTRSSAGVDMAFAPVILTAQSHTARAHEPEGDAPDANTHAEVAPAHMPVLTEQAVWVPSPFRLRSTVSILHPVRGPPTV